MDKSKKIIIAVALAAVVIYLLLKNKGTISGTSESTNRYDNSNMLDALGANQTFTSSVTVDENMSAMQKAEAQAKIEEEKAAYDQLKQLQAQHLTLTGKRG